MPKTTTKKKAAVTNERRSIIHIENCQVKSLQKARQLCAAIDTIEKECGIGSVRIRFKNNFICPDIDLHQLTQSTDPMERLIGELLVRIDISRNGKNSKYRKQPQAKAARNYPILPR